MKHCSLRYAVYNAILYLLAPLGGLYLLFDRPHRSLLHRFRPSVVGLGLRPVWVHACSVGELGVARAFIDAMNREFPEQPVVLTVSTVSGYKLAKDTVRQARLAWAPFDLPYSVRYFIRRARPLILVLVETEIWPNMVRESRKAGVPVVVVNGRISPKKYPIYKRYQHIIPPAFPLLSGVAAQNDSYAECFRALGVFPEVISTAGNLKYDAVELEVESTRLQRLRSENGFSKRDVLLIFGSTRPGDEALAAHCWQLLRDRFPELRLIVAPRHINRLDEALAPFSHEPVQLRSDIVKGKRNRQARVFFLDTLGELKYFYALSRVAVMGGSFFPGVEGHNPMEPVALGVTTVFGPFMGNFPDVAALLSGGDGALQLDSSEKLPSTLSSLLEQPDVCQRFGVAGRRLIISNRGATERNIELIRHWIVDGGAR